MFEAKCRKCGETFCPSGQWDMLSDDTAEHVTTTTDHECRGVGDIVSVW